MQKENTGLEISGRGGGTVPQVLCTAVINEEEGLPAVMLMDVDTIQLSV